MNADMEDNKTGSEQHQHNKHQQSSPRRKSLIDKDNLNDDDFDKLVRETSEAIKLNQDELNPDDAIKTDNSGRNRPSLSGHRASQQDHVIKINQPKRPMNAFMVWGRAVRREIHHRFSNVQNASLSKALGRVWRSLNSVDKEPYVKRANLIKTIHRKQFPNYRYQPRRLQEKEKRGKCHTKTFDCGNQSNSQINNEVSISNNLSRSSFLQDDKIEVSKISNRIVSKQPDRLGPTCDQCYTNGFAGIGGNHIDNYRTSHYGDYNPGIGSDVLQKAYYYDDQAYQQQHKSSLTKQQSDCNPTSYNNYHITYNMQNQLQQPQQQDYQPYT